MTLCISSCIHFEQGDHCPSKRCWRFLRDIVSHVREQQVLIWPGELVAILSRASAKHSVAAALQDDGGNRNRR